MKMKMIKWTFLLFYFSASFVNADDVYLPKFQNESQFEKKDKENKEEKEEKSIFIQGSGKAKLNNNSNEESSVFLPLKKPFDVEKVEGESSQSVFIRGEESKIDAKEDDNDFLESFSGHVPNHRLEKNFNEKLREIKRFSRTSFSMIYFQDHYKYSAPGKSFDQTFRDPLNSANPFFVQIGGNKIYASKWAQMGLGFRLAIGYMNGRGHFKNSDGTLDPNPSDTRMIFWTIPLDFAVSGEIPLGNFLKIGGAVGPSALVLIQNRSDAVDGQATRNVRRFGYGHFIEGNLKIELLGWFSDDYTRKMFHQYSMTNTFITVSARKVFYNHFSDNQGKLPKNKNIKIEGESFGIGLAYEFY